MRVKALIGSNSNDLSRTYVYLDQDQWDLWEPAIEFRDIDELSPEEQLEILESNVEEWLIDANFALHILLRG